MSSEFVPYLAGLRSRHASPASPGFAPMGAPGEPALPAAEPKVEVRRSGDRITHLHIHCRCGEFIEVECEY